MMGNLNKRQKGSITLISVLIVSALTLFLVLSMSEVNLATSQEYFNHSSDKVNTYTSHSCLEEALLRIESDTDFSSVTIIPDQDTVCTAVLNGNQLSLSSTYLNFTKNYLADILITQNGQVNNVKLSNWREIQ